jgi:hypothetical protein
VADGNVALPAKDYAGITTISGAAIMTSVSGKTKNGFTCEGDYE